MVSFTENPQNFDSLGTVRYLDAQLKEAISLEKKLGSFERELAGDPRYIQRVRMYVRIKLAIVWVSLSREDCLEGIPSK